MKKEEFIQNLRDEKQTGFDKVIIEEMVSFAEGLNLKELKGFKKMIFNFDGNTAKAFRSYKAIIKAKQIATFAPIIAIIGIWLNIAWLAVLGVLISISSSGFYYMMKFTKGNKIFSFILCLILGGIGTNILYSVLFY